MSGQLDPADDGTDPPFPEDIHLEVERLIQRVSWAAEVRLGLSNRPELRRVHATVVNCLGFGRGEHEPLGAVVLVVDELVSNAYRHTATPGVLGITRTSRGLLVEVTDDDPDAERMRARADERFGSGHHGLRLVAHLSLEWGVRPEESGKVVWALVPAQLYFEP